MSACPSPSTSQAPATPPASFDPDAHECRLRWWTRQSVILLILFVLPFLCYWNTIFLTYAFRDDYSYLREATQEPGKIVRVCTGMARPFYGACVEESFAAAGTIANLKWLRFTGVLGLGLLSIVAYRALIRLDWRPTTAAAAAATMAFIPSAQVIASWAIGWAYTIPLIFSVIAFGLSQGALTHTHWRLPARATAIASAIILLIIAALTYQSNALLYCAFVVAALPTRRAISLTKNLRWLTAHGAILACGLGFAYIGFKLLLPLLEIAPSGRVGFVKDLAHKVSWFFREPLLNALNPLSVASYLGGKENLLGVAAVVLALIALGACIEVRRRGHAAGSFWFATLILMLPFSFAVNLVVADWFTTYRTLFAMAALIVVAIYLSLENILECFPRAAWTYRRTLYAILALTALFFAKTNSFENIALPQMKELLLLKMAAEEIHLVQKHPPKVYLIEPTISDISSEVYFADEFGSLTTMSDPTSNWAPREAFLRVLTERFPRSLPPELLLRVRLRHEAPGKRPLRLHHRHARPPVPPRRVTPAPG